MANTISNSDDVIDSRDVIERIAELEGERDALADEDGAISEKKLAEWNEGEAGTELKNLLTLQEEADGYVPDWKYGAGLVRETYWVEYVEEMLKDIGDLPQKLPHYIVIDWEATAENIKVDYTSVEFDGVTYWVR